MSLMPHFKKATTQKCPLKITKDAKNFLLCRQLVTGDFKRGVSFNQSRHFV